MQEVVPYGGFSFNYGLTGINSTEPVNWEQPIAMDPLHPKTLYIASDINVMVTANLGASWSVLGSGLPDVTVHDLAFHPASRTLAAFTHGRSVYTYQIPASSSSVSVGLRPGWNLVSNPVQMADNSLGTIFPGAVTHAFRYESRSYHAGDTLLPGGGYWVKFPPGVLSPRVIDGAMVSSASVAVVEGWNLIGSISAPVSVTTITSEPPGLVTSQFFLFDGRYVTTNTIEPGNGYWVKSSASGTLMLSSSSAASLANRIVIRPSTELPPPFRRTFFLRLPCPLNSRWRKTIPIRSIRIRGLSINWRSESM